jgi:hypothetical protein
MHTKVDRFRLLTASILILFVTVFVAPACAPAATPQTDYAAATNDAAMQQTLDVLRLQLNQTATAEKNALLQQATLAAQTPTAAVTPTPTNTFTPTPNLLKTQQAAAMFLKVQQYARDNYLTSTSGTYQRLNDQIHYYSKLDFYNWTATGMVADDFVFESDLVMENTTRVTRDHLAGCGLLFHSDGNSNYIMAYLGMDGNVYMSSVSDGYFHPLGKTPFGKEEVSQANAHIALVVSGNHYTILVNDKMTMQSKSDADRQKTGALAYVVFSGSDKGTGTTCKFTNIDLWTVKPTS